MQRPTQALRTSLSAFRCHLLNKVCYVCAQAHVALRIALLTAQRSRMPKRSQNLSKYAV